VAKQMTKAEAAVIAAAVKVYELGDAGDFLIRIKLNQRLLRAVARLLRERGKGK
jgi:hypothetical protein